MGSHIAVELLKRGESVVVLDNLINSDDTSLERVRSITGCDASDLIHSKVDLLDKEGLRAVFEEHTFDACIHVAALKNAGGSIVNPLLYYRVNLTGTLNLIALLKEYDVKNLVFSSSADVYGNPKTLPITEDTVVLESRINSPYGKTKAMAEAILQDESAADPTWKIIILRYFNAIGADRSGLIGEDNWPNNLIGSVMQVSVDKREFVPIFGNNYATHDGTPLRDYVHVTDVALAHVRAVEVLRRKDSNVGCVAVNIGTGLTYSSFDIIRAMEEVTATTIPYKVVPRRPGAPASLFVDPTFAKTFLQWEATRDLKQMCIDAWRWHGQNPEGYDEIDNIEERKQRVGARADARMTEETSDLRRELSKNELMLRKKRNALRKKIRELVVEADGP